jgi:transposase
MPPRPSPRHPWDRHVRYAYFMGRMKYMEHYLQDGELQIDNSPIENLIRPVALGRKNYLFAGSQEGSKRLAMA